MLAFETAARKVNNPGDLNALFGQEVRRFGFTAYAVGYIPHGEPQTPETAREPFLLIDWPRAWLELYARQGFAREDVVIAEAQRATAPFTWKELQARRPGASARIFAAASAFGWDDGLLVPVRDAADGQRTGVVSLAAAKLDHLDPSARERVVAIAVLTFRRAAALAETSVPTQAQPAALTRRERDALTLVARGCDDAAIGAVLGLTRTTAHSYVERAKRRLGAATRAQAVALALTQGLLDPNRNA